MKERSGMPYDAMTVAELDALLSESIAAAEARIEAHHERLALQYAHIDTSENATTERAIAALQRRVRFCGEDDLALAWLTERRSHAGIFRKRDA